ncbi:hypothetical protein D9Q98_009467 [Chlorella vulgaris]|uniref:Metallo-beta-lactamase domain-containing protein n=1 Tax=Chlorella vulgaris TaxID=3077 RepID=A0A9D4YSV3_CHLVU|nr:hypothetical protein D9Q98_009467 [Chlorella vulgaris]
MLRGALAVITASLAFQLLLLRSQPAPRFVQVAGNLFSLTQWWAPIPGLPSCPVSVFLVRQGGKEGSWALIDAGVGDSWHQAPGSQLLTAVQQSIPAGEHLAVIALTHTHFDHVGALPLLLGAYSGVEVVVHEVEQPYLIGSQTWAEEAAANAGSKNWLLGGLLHWAARVGQQPVKVPAARVHSLDARVPDLSPFGVFDLLWVATPGHSPGHVGFLHKPSHTLVAGDALTFLRPQLRRRRYSGSHDARLVRTFILPPPFPSLALIARPYTLCPPFICNKREAQNAVCLLADDALDYEGIYVAHDLAASRGGGWTKGKVQELAGTMPACRQAVAHGDYMITANAG